MASDLLLGRMAVARGLLSNAQLEEALAEQQAREPKPPLGILLLAKGYLRQETLDGLMQSQNRMLKIRDPRTRERLEDRTLAQILLKEKMAAPEAVNRALEMQAKGEEQGRWRRLGDILVSRGDLTWELLARALEIQINTVRICPICAAQLPAPTELGAPVACPRCASQVNSHSTLAVPSSLNVPVTPAAPTPPASPTPPPAGPPAEAPTAPAPPTGDTAAGGGAHEETRTE